MPKSNIKNCQIGMLVRLNEKDPNKKTQLQTNFEMGKAGAAAADAAHDDFALHHDFHIEPEDPVQEITDWMTTVVNLFDDAVE